MKIAFIGGGNMGQAMLSAIINKGLASPQDITVGDKNGALLKQLKADLGVNTGEDNRQVVAGGNIIVLAIKPQTLDEVNAEIGGCFQPGQLALSIIAGKSLASLKQGLKHDAVVRAMPNTPAQISRGTTVWTTSDAVNDEQKEAAGAILGALGQQIYVADEGLIDMATAVSGSGPAYVFLMIESLIGAAAAIGLPRDTAEELVLQTVLGAGHFLRQSRKTPAELRQMVTSPGGTTAAALQRLEAGNFSGLLQEAVAAAYNRARELGGQA